MQNIIECRVRVPPINLASWMPEAEDGLTFPFQREDITGTVFINLDAKAVEYDVDGGVTETGEYTVVREEPIACHRILLRIEGQFEEPVAAETTLNTPRLAFLKEHSPAELKFLQAAYELAVEYIRRLVFYIQLDLGQYWVDLDQTLKLGLWNFFQQTEAKYYISDTRETKEIEIEKLVILPVDEREFEEHEPLDETNWMNMQRSLNKMSEPDISQRLIAEAKRRYENHDHHMAAVQAISALELELKEFTKRRCKQQGVDNPGKLHFYNSLNTFFRLVVKETEFDNWLAKRPKYGMEEVIRRCNTLNEFRNDVIHEKVVSSSIATAVEQGIEAAEWLLKFIRSANLHR